MLQPTRLKYRKQQKGRNTGIATRGNKVSFGEFGLKAVGRGRLTARQIEAARRTMTRHIKRGGRIWIRVFPDKPITEKLSKFVWVAVKVMWNITLLKLNQAKYCTKWTVFLSLWLVKHLNWPLPNCLFLQPLW